MVDAERTSCLLLIGSGGTEEVELVIVHNNSLISEGLIKSAGNSLARFFVSRKITHGFLQSFGITFNDSLTNAASSDIFLLAELRELSQIFIDIAGLTDIRADGLTGFVAGFVLDAVRRFCSVTWCQNFCWFF